jgi:hypothetical protein
MKKLICILALTLTSTLAASTGSLFLEDLVDDNIIHKGLQFLAGDAINSEIPITLNFTDYMINAALVVANPLLAKEAILTNDTASDIPITLDTHGLSQIIPELESYVKTNTKVSLKVYRDPLLHAVPTIKTTFTSYVTFQFGFDLSIWKEESASYVQLFKSKISGFIKFQLSPENDKLSVFVNKMGISEAELSEDILGVNAKRFLGNLNMALKIALPGIEEKTTHIDVLERIKQSGGGEYKELDAFQEHGYIFFSLK